MLKKSLVVGAGLLLLALLFATPFTRSHLVTAWEQGKQMVNEAEPIKYQIERAKTMIKQLDPEIRRCEHLIAKGEVDVDQRVKDLENANDGLAQRKADIERLKAHLDDGGGTFYVGTRSYSQDRVEQDLEIRFAKYKTCEATRDKLEMILNARQKAVRAARDKLAEMRSAKSQLEIEVANLEARLEMVEAAQTASNINIDDSALAQTKELVQNIRTRIDVAEKMVNTDTDFSELIPLDQKAEADSNISDEIAEYFGQTDEGTINLATASKK